VRYGTFSPDGHHLLAVEDQELKLWSVSTGGLSHTWPLTEAYCATHCGFSADGKLCAVGGGGYTMGMGWYAAWDLSTSSQVCHGELAGTEQEEIGVVKIGPAADGRFAAWSKEQCNLPTTAFVHDLQTGQCVAKGKFEGDVRLFPPTYLAATESEEGFALVDLSSGESWVVSSGGDKLPVGSARGSWLAWLDDSDTRDQSGHSGSLVVYDVGRREIRHKLPLDPAYGSLRFSPFHDDVLATITNCVKWKGSPEYTLFWHVPSGTPFAWAQRHQMHACYTFSADGRWFASGVNGHSSACDSDRIAPGIVLLTDLGDNVLNVGRIQSPQRGCSESA
jgi:WD40 repeat protein